MRVFLSYRREDTEISTGFLAEHFQSLLGADCVFHDIQSILAGANFHERIVEEIQATDAVLVVIGDKWLTVSDDKGNRRLNDPQDYVRLEIKTAFQKNRIVVPLLMPRAVMPAGELLPKDLRPFANCQAIELGATPDELRRGADRVIREINEQLYRRQQSDGTPTTGIDLRSDIHMVHHLLKQGDTGRDLVESFALSHRLVWERRSIREDPAGMYLYALCLEEGWGVKQNFKEAEKLYRKAAESDLPFACAALGDFYYYGTRGKSNYSEAVKWYRKAAELGDADAQFALGICYHEGEGVKRNPTEAVRWYTRAADQDHPDAQHNLAVCYALGEGAPKDPVQSAHWYRRAAEQNLASAQCSLGLCYLRGEGVETSSAEAVKWLQLAVDQGDARACCELGICYARGEGVAKNSEQAAKLYRCAAEGESREGMFLLGRCYACGDGISKNKKLAKEWLQKAADQGHKEAGKLLRSL